MPPLLPMLAKSSPELPDAEPGAFWFEPKWDGFRCIVFRDGDEIELGSRNDKPLTRYFPELLEPLKASLPERCVVDGEVVVAGADGLDFDALQQRIHPAESRVNRLAEETPAQFVAFDLLALDDRSLLDTPLGRAAGAARAGARRPGAVGPPHARHLRPGHGHRLVLPLRGRRARRRHGQGRRRHLPAEQAGPAQGEAPAHRGRAWSPGSASTRTATAPAR